MYDYRDILNKHYVIRLSAREIRRQTGMSKSGVLKFIHAFKKCEELDYPLPPGITNAGISMKVYGKVPGEGGRDESYEYPNYPQVLKFMNERKNMTLQLCWERYTKRCIAEQKKPYQYRQFCELFSKRCEVNYETGHFTAVIAQTMEVGFAGKTFAIGKRMLKEFTQEKRLPENVRLWCRKYAILFHAIYEDEELQKTFYAYNAYQPQTRFAGVCKILKDCMKEAYNSGVVIPDYDTIIKDGDFSQNDLFYPSSEWIATLSHRQILAVIAWHFRRDHFNEGSWISETVAKGYMATLADALVD